MMGMGIVTSVRGLGDFGHGTCVGDSPLRWKSRMIRLFSGDAIMHCSMVYIYFSIHSITRWFTVDLT